MGVPFTYLGLPVGGGHISRGRGNQLFRNSRLSLQCGRFSINSLYYSLYSFLQPPVLLDPDPIFSRVWHCAAPSNAKVFIWRLWLGRIPSLENLWKRKVVHSREAAICKLCCVEVESCAHLLFACLVTLDIWRNCYGWLGVSTALPMVPRDHLLQFNFGWNQNQ